MSGEEGSRIQEVNDKIRSLIESRVSLGAPYLLSQLGKDIGDDLQYIKLVTGMRFSDYIERHFGEDYALVATGTHSNIKAIVRSPEAALPIVQSASAGVNIRTTRYHHRFWAAFAVPAKATRRFLNMSDFLFIDTRDVEPPGGDYREIPLEFIPPAEMPERDKKIAENIERWLEREGLGPEAFLPGKAARSLPSVAGGASLLHALIEALDRRQLASTHLPLDVVSTLLHKRA